MQFKQYFVLDNYVGFCLELLKYFLEVNGSGYELVYGDDLWMQCVCDCICDLFEIDCEVFFVFNGMVVNLLVLLLLCQLYYLVICYELVYIEMDECGGLEFFLNGFKLLIVKGENGKFMLDVVEVLVMWCFDIYYLKLKVVLLMQLIEVGIVYIVDEVCVIVVIVKCC